MDDPSKTGSEPWADEEVEQTGAYLGSGFGHTSLDLTSPFPDPGEHRRLVASGDRAVGGLRGRRGRFAGVCIALVAAVRAGAHRQRRGQRQQRQHGARGARSSCSRSSST